MRFCAVLMMAFTLLSAVSLSFWLYVAFRMLSAFSLCGLALAGLVLITEAS